MKTKEINLGYIRIADWKITDKLFSSWFYEEPEYASEIKACDPKTIVLPPNKEYILIINYPVRENYVTILKTGKIGMNRVNLIDFICRHYRKMYKEEQDTPAIDGCGKYGIRYHDIGDLMLHSADVNGNKITLGVDS